MPLKATLRNILLCVLLFAAASPVRGYAQVIPPNERNFRVEGGVIRDRLVRRAPIADSLRTQVFTAADSLEASELGMTLIELDSMRITHRLDSLATARHIADSTTAAEMGITLDELADLRRIVRLDSLETARIEAARAADTIPPDSMTRRERRQYERALWKADTTVIKHNRFFRDSIPISRVTAISLVAPGFAQLYNDQPWKIPILYGSVGVSSALWVNQQKKYNKLRNEYEYLLATVNRTRDHAEYNRQYEAIIEPVQSKMIRQNTTRQLAMFATIGSYVYFIAEGVANYPGSTTQVKKATTLSTILPGAGQIYNRSYWKAPIVMGGFATFAFMIDWNNRGFNRFRTAYVQVTTAEANAIDGQTPNYNDEFNGRYSAEMLRNLKNSYRRNRDLCIILTGAFYLLNVIDAHVDAHMKDYDISDDLAFNVQPTIMNFASSGRSRNTFGLSLNITF